MQSFYNMEYKRKPFLLFDRFNWLKNQNGDSSCTYFRLIEWNSLEHSYLQVIQVVIFYNLKFQLALSFTKRPNTSKIHRGSHEITLNKQFHIPNAALKAFNCSTFISSNIACQNVDGAKELLRTCGGPKINLNTTSALMKAFLRP